MEKEKLYKEIEKLFLPAKEIEIPELFCGRKEEIVQGITALRSPGASLCIYGGRGLGKTSVAKQLRLVAAGDTMLTDLIGRPELFDQELFCIPTLYFSCDDTIQNANDLFRKILSDRDSMNGICKYNNGIILQRTKEKTTASAKLTYKILESSVSSEEEVENVMAEQDPVSAFKSVTSEIVDTAGMREMVVVIDEFERVADKIGIASIIRSTPHVKFIIVGVADDLRALVKDHESIKRQLAEGKIKITPMEAPVLADILIKAEKISGMTFEKEVIARIVALSNGYPHWVHLLGKWSCIDAIDNGSINVAPQNLQRALEKIVKHEPDYESAYQEIAAPSKETELVLKLLSLDQSEQQNLSDIYEKAQLYGLGAELWNAAIKHLISKDVVKISQTGFVVFNSVQFKIFCGMRKPLYKDNSKASIERVEKSKQYSMIWDYDFKPFEVKYIDITNSYNRVSAFVPIQGWTQLINKEDVVWSVAAKPKLYDSKGKLIK